jgi:hypothetical protein
LAVLAHSDGRSLFGAEVMDAAERASRIMLKIPESSRGEKSFEEAAGEWGSAHELIADQLRQAEQAARERALEEAARYHDKEAAAYERVGDRLADSKADVANESYNCAALHEKSADMIRALKGVEK